MVTWERKRKNYKKERKAGNISGNIWKNTIWSELNETKKNKK